MFRSNICTFCSQTGLHGPSYIVQGRNRLESLVWVVLVLLAITCALYFCAVSFVEFSREPLVRSVRTLQHPPEQVPFPVLTFCPVQRKDELQLVATVLNRVI